MTSKNMVLTDGGTSVRVRYSPMEVSKSSIARVWDEIEHDGKAYLFNKGEGIPQLSFSIEVVGYNGASVERDLGALAALAKSTRNVRVLYTSLETGVWHITSMTINSVKRRPGTQAVTWAKVDVELKSALQFVRNQSPVDKANKVKGLGRVGKGGGTRRSPTNRLPRRRPPSTRTRIRRSPAPSSRAASGRRNQARGYAGSTGYNTQTPRQKKAPTAYADVMRGKINRMKP